MTIRTSRTSSRPVDREDIDAVVHLRSVGRCRYERRGFDPLSVALHLLADTGDLPGWDSAGLDDEEFDEWDWAA
ncbi:hypothetical protein [Nocardia sp. NPDC051832]|uniref:hypothetical protein n=1 Tax=Nocardia sp. NPDC051832 TaxID=3155673 RepID=UPI003448064B